MSLKCRQGTLSHSSSTVNKYSGSFPHLSWCKCQLSNVNCLYSVAVLYTHYFTMSTTLYYGQCISQRSYLEESVCERNYKHTTGCIECATDSNGFRNHRRRLPERMRKAGCPIWTLEPCLYLALGEYIHSFLVLYFMNCGENRVHSMHCNAMHYNASWK